jgi:LPXTG-site transpeptidase (sortase) family protein
VLSGAATSALLAAVVVLTGCSQSSDQQLFPKAVPSVPVETTAPSLSPSPTVEPTATPEPSAEANPVAATPTAATLAAAPAAARTATLYSIEIRRLGIKLPVIEGDVSRDVDRAQTPEHYAFHLPGTSMFGPGNTYIYAHARVGMFLNLWNARLGDIVIVETPKGLIEYTVAEIHARVPPTEVSWADPTSDTRLTLQTSTGPYGTDPRFVVAARPR